MTNARFALMRAAMVLGCLANAASAQDADWRTELSSAALVRASVYRAVPLADGGAAFTTTTAAGHWLVRIDAAGDIVSRSRILREGTPIEVEGGAVVVLDGEHESPTLGVDDICFAERTAQGPVLARTVFDHDDFGHGLAGFFAPSLNSFHAGRDSPVHAFGRDCRSRRVLDLGGRRVRQIVQDAPARAAWVLSEEIGSSSSPALLYVDRDGVRWNVALQGSVALLPGDRGIHVASRAGDALTLVQLDRAGRERWKRTFALADAVASPAGLLVTSYEVVHGTIPTPISLSLVADDGRDRWVVRLIAPRHLYWPIRSAAPGTSLFLHLREGAAWDGVAEVDVATGESIVRVPPGSGRPLAVLADGSVLMQAGSLPDSGALALWRRGAAAPVAIATNGVAPGVDRPLALLEDAGVSYVFVRDGAGPRVSRVDADGRTAWSRALLPGFDNPPRTALARDLVCALRDVLDTSPGQLRLECLDTASGTPAFAPRTWPGRVNTARLQGVGDHIHVYAVDLVVANGAVASRRTHRTLDRHGNVVREHTTSGDASIPIVAPNGSYLTRDATTLFRFGPDDERRFAVPLASLGIDASRAGTPIALDDGALVGELAFGRPGLFVRLDDDGRVRWRTPAEPDTSLSRLGRDWLKWTFDGSTHALARIDDRDGSPQWSRRERWAPGRRVSLADPEGRAFLVRAPFWSDPHVLPAPAGDTWWYDGLTGRRIGAFTGPVDEAPAFTTPGTISRIDRGGALLTLRTEIDHNHGRVVLARRRLASSAADPRAAARYAAGRWVAVGLAGHSLDLAIDRSGRIEGRWLTFAPGGGNEVDRQRWFRLDGVAPAATDRFALSIRAPSASPFDGAPSYRSAGSIAWRQHACSEAEIDYRFEGAMDDIEGRMRLVRADAFDCERIRARPRPDSGLWSMPEGSAIVLHHAPDGSATGAWTTHAPAASAEAGIPQWLELDVDAGGMLTIARTLGGAFESRATTNTWAIGSGRLEHTACGTARLHYQFLDDELAEPFDGRRGEVELTRVGGCSR